MPTQSPEFHKGARVRITSYGGPEGLPSHAYNGLVGIITAVYGGKFYRVELDEDPDPQCPPLMAYAHEMELFND
jgi:hypothetical protein